VKHPNIPKDLVIILLITFSVIFSFFVLRVLTVGISSSYQLTPKTESYPTAQPTFDSYATPVPCSGRNCPPRTEPLTKLYDQIRNGEVKKVVARGVTLIVTLKNDIQESVYIPNNTDLKVDLLPLEGIVITDANRFEYEIIKEEEKVPPPPQPGNPISSFLMFGLLLGGIFLILRFVGRLRSNPPTNNGRKFEDKNKNQTGHQSSSDNPGASRVSIEQVTFKDVAGVDEAKIELEEVVDFLKNPEKFTSLGARMPRGVLLIGPPGTGKTLLARAVAGTARVPFFSANGSDFVEMFVGVGSSRIRKLFETARANSPCVVFIDEIDAVGRKRGSQTMGGGGDEYAQTLNALLHEMDGFDIRNGVMIIGATNRPDVLDPSLLRPGRFDRQVMVDIPDRKGRVAILKVHAKGKKLAKAVKLYDIAKRTPGFSGADLANVLNEAAILASRRNGNEILSKDIDDAIDRIVAGPEKKTRLLTESEKKLIAWHECGHAVARFFASRGYAIPDKISIVARGRALGLTWYTPDRDILLQSKSDLLVELASDYGGFVAEDILLKGDITTGPSSDLKQATRLARRMVTDFAMGDDLPTRTYDIEENNLIRSFSQETQDKIDNNIAIIINQAKDTARHAIEDNMVGFEGLVAEVIRAETLEGEALIKEFIKNFAGTEAVKNTEARLFQKSETVDDDKEETSALPT